jgi:hypothetical protein
MLLSMLCKHHACRMRFLWIGGLSWPWSVVTSTDRDPDWSRLEHPCSSVMLV